MKIKDKHTMSDVMEYKTISLELVAEQFESQAKYEQAVHLRDEIAEIHVAIDTMRKRCGCW